MHLCGIPLTNRDERKTFKNIPKVFLFSFVDFEVHSKLSLHSYYVIINGQQRCLPYIKIQKGLGDINCYI